MFFPHLLIGVLIAYFIPVGLVPAILCSYSIDLIDKPLSLIGLTSARSIFFHSWLVLAPLIAWLAIDRKNKLALALLVGIASHLLIDTLDAPGIPLFYPLSATNIYLGAFKSYYPLGAILAGDVPAMPDPALLAAEGGALVASIAIGYVVWKKEKAQGKAI